MIKTRERINIAKEKNTVSGVTPLLCTFYSRCERGDTSFLHVNKRQLAKTQSLPFNDIELQ